MGMKRLILTTDSSGAGCLMQAGIADIVIPLGFRFTSGPSPSNADFANSLAARSAKNGPTVPHWQDDIGWSYGKTRRKGLGLIDLCEQCETVELWIDPDPNAQLVLIWLLDYFRPHGGTASKLTLVQADVRIGSKFHEDLAKWRPSAVEVTNNHLETAGLAWQAYRAPTPPAWFNLLDEDLSALPQLRQTVLELLEELPTRLAGLGATEMRMLELISAGNVDPFDVFPGHWTRNQRRVFGYWEAGSLLDGLAHCPAPAVFGLDEGPFTDEMHTERHRLERYKRSELKLTALGEDIVAGRDDFSRHNPIHRWWGGTELTNDRLWRWDPVNRALVEP
jgi:hypothetical protein